MLAGRLRAAEAYLAEHPGVCVLSGGQGADERVSEARAMYVWLTARGIAPERLLLEEKSTSTRENFAFSAEVARKNGITTTNVVVVTDGFHEFRAHHIAKSLGLTPYTRASWADAGLIAFFWAREIGGVVWQTWLRN
jgi:uncharacterized SAM-binding protein YcdF (DUF218 family)